MTPAKHRKEVEFVAVEGIDVTRCVLIGIPVEYKLALLTLLDHLLLLCLDPEVVILCQQQLAIDTNEKMDI